MITTIQKWGNSQGLRFSKAIMQEAQINVGEDVHVSVQNGKIVVAALHRIRGKYSLDDLVAQMPDDYAVTEVDWGQSVGNEVW
ncbi:MAG TPA: transcriptional regulator/antitoxin, MazE [Anaerolineae bacterium]|nr:transcriptional regulator/antitoxin, MazE [Anaerolineae bacterium]